MKILNVTLILAALSLMGCNQIRKALFPTDADNAGTHTDPSTVCRAQYMPIYRDAGSPQGLTDDTVVITKETNGVDGASITVELCKNDAQGHPIECLMAANDGMLGGALVEFQVGQVEVKMALTSGFVRMIVRIKMNCHGG